MVEMCENRNSVLVGMCLNPIEIAFQDFHFSTCVHRQDCLSDINGVHMQIRGLQHFFADYI